MPKEGAFHHLIIVSYPSQDKRSKGNGCAIQHDFMLLTVRIRDHYEPLSESESGRIIGLKEAGFGQIG
ncbi:hypothetical protein TNCV_3604381 [Trichonephila clavipes]|nr:hypothetical protein TNCV_3604381 [Trichonephila clavipes]